MEGKVIQKRSYSSLLLLASFFSLSQKGLRISSNSMKHDKLVLGNGLLTVVLFVAAIAQPVIAKSWTASELEVHEWGVNLYDWGSPSSEKKRPLLPKHYYTDKKPGQSLPRSSRVKDLFRVNDLPPNSGMRLKPLLYFYPKNGESVQVGIEMRFKHGHANAWYPQVNVYRTPEETRDAKAINRDQWRTDVNANVINIAPHPGSCPEFRLTRAVPDDKRFELVWDSLMLNPKNKVDVKRVRSDSWVKDARKVDAATVSNGKEAEKFVFYEGATRELPACTVIAAQNGVGYQLVNSSHYPIYDVFVIYHKNGVRHVSYAAKISPMARKANATEIDNGRIMMLPDYDALNQKGMTDEEYQAATSKRLIQVLVAKKKTDAHKPVGVKAIPTINVSDNCSAMKFGPAMTLRAPAFPQRATMSHTLFTKEAVGLEKIWRNAFFQSEGITIIYRESPRALDDAMPLHIYTDIFHFITLNRCGLVCNNNVPLKKITAIQRAIDSLIGGKKFPTQKQIKLCQESLLASKTYLQYLKRQGHDPHRLALIELAIEVDLGQ